MWGDNHCEHRWALDDKQTGQKHWNQGGQVIPNEDRIIHNGGITRTGFCSLCGAWKGSYGLEPTPELYIEHTILILREIRRVLRKDGVVFLNLGDSYAGSWGNRSHRPETKHLNKFDVMPADKEPPTVLRGHPVLKPKDLCLIPFRVAIACQEDGWWVRSVIIWSKPNPMPESVTDRPTESHEYILMLTKSARYYWDADAVREAQSQSETATQRYKYAPDNSVKKRDIGDGKPDNVWSNYYINPAGRNIRSVWEFPTQPYPEAHFAVFPEKLPETCIKAATPEVGCCSKCGAPWERVIEKGEYDKHESETQTKAVRGLTADRSKHSPPREVKNIGWRPTCDCNADKNPSLVLDPFAGAGTTLWVAKKLGRRAVGYELSREYCELSVERNRQQALDF